MRTLHWALAMVVVAFLIGTPARSHDFAEIVVVTHIDIICIS